MRYLPVPHPWRGSLRLCDSAILPNRPHRHRDLQRLWRAGAGAIASIEDPTVIGQILAHVGEGQAPMKPTKATTMMRGPGVVLPALAHELAGPEPLVSFGPRRLELPRTRWLAVEIGVERGLARISG
jgi:hypothetical protein